jgi:hypothetical protein
MTHGGHQITDDYKQTKDKTSSDDLQPNLPKIAMQKPWRIKEEFGALASSWRISPALRTGSLIMFLHSRTDIQLVSFVPASLRIGSLYYHRLTPRL